MSKIIPEKENIFKGNEGFGKELYGIQKRHKTGRIFKAFIGLTSLLLASCAAGPDFQRPSPPGDLGYLKAPPPGVIAPKTGGQGQDIVMGQEISSKWWELFHVPELDNLLRDTVRMSRTLSAARATLAAARETVTATKGGLFPQADFSAGFDRRRASGATQASDLYSLSPSASYKLDLFGNIRRRVEQQQALAEFQGYELAADYLTLTGDAVTQAITIASLRSQIKALEDVISEDERNLSLVRLMLEAGKVARTDLLTAETQLASDRTSLPPLRQQLSVARHSLSVLAGRTTAEWSPPDFDLTDFNLPEDLPLTLPSKLVRQRPDILAAEAKLHADSAAIGIAASQLYPDITLSGSLGQQSIDAGSLFRHTSRFWDIAADLTGPIFHGGTLKAQKRAAVDTFKASLATYEQTVLQAFQQVADTLRALSNEAEQTAASKQLLDTASEALALQRLSYRSGKSDILQLINAERAYQEARLGYTRVNAQRLLDTAQLFVVLGGGWRRSSDLTDAPE